MANDITKRRTGLKRLDSLFERLLGKTGRSPELTEFEKSFRPSLDLSEDEKQYIIELEAPGLESDQLEISVSDHVLTIKGQKEETEEREERNFHQVERRFGTFTRQVAVPEIDKDQDIEDAYERGVLTITVPKSREEQTKKIEVDVK